MRTEWRVGVLRRGEENTEWTAVDVGEHWAAAREATLAALRNLAAREGRQELRFQVGDVHGTALPGLHEVGDVDVTGLGESVPHWRE